MARFKIYSSDGTTVRYEGTPVYNGTYLKASYLEFREINSPVPIDWQVGDYVVYERTGYTYRLYSIPQPKKSARRETYGGAFTYQNVQFHSAEKQLEIAPFRDIVLADNNIHFSTIADVNTFENVEGIANRIQANLDQMYPGSWTVSVNLNLDADLLESVKEAREFSVSNGSCMDALDQIYSVWEDVGWVYSYNSTTNKNVLTIAGSNARTSANTTSKFEYGKGKGLKSLKKGTGNSDEIATRLYVYGNTTNMVNRYYNGKDIVDAASVNIQHLMIPLSSWGQTGGKPDAKLAYLQSSNAVVSKLGLIPKTVYFDGSEYEDIYPSISKMTMKDIRDAKDDLNDTTYYPSTAYTDSERADEIKAVENPLDNGDVGSTGNSYTAITKVYSTLMSRSIDTTQEETIIDLTTASITAVSDSSVKVTVTPNIVGLLSATSFIPAISLVLYSGETKLKEENCIYESTPLSVSEPVNILFPELKVTTSEDLTNLSIKLRIKKGLYGPDGVASITLNTGEFAIRTVGKLTTTFVIYLKQIGFDINDRISLSSEGKCTVAFKDGMCGGRSFAVKSAVYRQATDDWMLTMKRGDDSSLGMYFPNSIYQIKAGDHFVLLDLCMPDIYVNTAERRLLAAGQKLLADVARIKPNYEPEIDPKVMVENNWKIREGMFMHISDADAVDDGSAYVLIDSLTITEGETNLPSYKVTLREQKSYSFRQSISTASALSTASSGTSQEVASDPVETDGTKDYNELDNQPRIDGKVLKGSKSSYNDLGLINQDQFEVVNVGSEASPKLALKAKYPFFSNQEVYAFGIGEPTSGGGSGLDGLLTEWNYTSEKSGYALGAELGNLLHTDLESVKTDVSQLKSKSTSVSVTTNYTSGNAVATIKVDGVEKTIYVPNVTVPVTSVVGLTGAITADQLKTAIGLSRYMLTTSFTKNNIKSTLGIYDWALASSKPSYSFSEIGSKPTSLSGYGITDAYTKTETETKLAGYATTSSLSAVEKKIDDEVTRAVLADDNHAEYLLLERNQRIAKDNELKGEIDAEVARSMGEEVRIEGKLSQMFTLMSLSDGTLAIKANYGLYTERFLSAFGLDGDNLTASAATSQQEKNDLVELAKAAMTTMLLNYPKKSSLATINGQAITNGGNITTDDWKVVRKTETEWSLISSNPTLLASFLSQYEGYDLEILEDEKTTPDVTLTGNKVSLSGGVTLSGNKVTVEGATLTGNKITI